jgi:hypothetical protein
LAAIKSDRTGRSHSWSAVQAGGSKNCSSGLKAAEHGRIENLFRRECPATLDEVVEGRNLVALANLAEDPQRILYRRW